MISILILVIVRCSTDCFDYSKNKILQTAKLGVGKTDTEVKMFIEKVNHLNRNIC